MKNLLDLIQEFATLNKAKTLARGVLPADGEARWSELREFYELLMEQDGLCAQPVARHSASEIRTSVTTRGRLRVRADLEIVMMKDSDVHYARVGNLSCGGVLLLSDTGFDTGSEILLQLSNVSRGADLISASGKIVWRVDTGSTNGTFRYRMGFQFAGLAEKDEKSLDAYVVDSLETKLLSLSKDALPSGFAAREQLAI